MLIGKDSTCQIAWCFRYSKYSSQKIMGKLPVFVIAVLLYTLVTPACQKNDVEINSQADFEGFIANEMEDQKIPAMAVLIFREDDILLEQYLGNSNIADNISLEADHLFLIASISKVITATALLQLFDEGKFELDDPINDYLPFKVAVPGYSEQITFRMLLTHSSGIEDNYSVMDKQYYYNQDPPITLSYFIEQYLKPGGEFYDVDDNFYDFRPGTKHEYSNIGSALIGVLVENISGKDFNTYCKDHIFKPLGMDNSFWLLSEITQTIATPYDYENGRNKSIEHYTNTDYPNGGLRTTARDLHKLLFPFVNEGQSGNYQVLKKETIQLMLTPQLTTDDDEIVGLHLFYDEEYNLWGHDGGEQGVATIMAFNPVTKTGAIVFTNQGEADLDDVLIAAYQLGEQL